MSSTTNMTHGSHPTKPHTQVIRLEIKDKNIFPTSFPEQDGWHRARLYDNDGKLVVSNYMVQRIGTQIEIYNMIVAGGYLVRKMTCDIHAKAIMPDGGRSTLQDAVMDIVIEKCGDVVKVFEEIAPNLKIVDVNGNEVVGDKRKRGPEGKKVWTGKRGGGVVKPKVEGGGEETNGFMDLRTFEDKYRLVKGHMQSGKTAFMISSAIWFALNGKHSIIVTRGCNDDSNQLRDRIEKYSEMIEARLADTEFAGMFSVLASDSTVKEAELMGMPRIIVAIGHDAPLTSIAKLVESNPDRFAKSYTLFVDEVDFVDSADTKVRTALNRIRSSAFCTFGVSGTILDAAMSEEVEKGNLIILSRPEFYKGIENFRICSFEKESVITTTVDGDMFANDPNLRAYLKDFHEREHDREYGVGIHNGEKMPMDTLIRASLANQPNKRALAEIQRDYPQTPAMVYTGGGKIHLSLTNHRGPIVLADGSRGKLEELGGDLEGLYYTFKNTTPGYVKQWLHENGGVKKYPRIITLAGRTATRSISFGAANFEICREKNKLWWHLTEMYLVAADKGHQPDLLQVAARLAVVAKDSVPLTLYATKRVHEDIIKSYWTQEELIERALAKQGSMRLGESMKNMPIFSGKVSSRPLTMKGEHKLNKVSEEEDAEAGGWYKEESYINIDHETGDLIEEEVFDIGEEEEEEEDEDEEERSGNMIPPPPARSTSLVRQYNTIVANLETRPGVWVSLAELRGLFQRDARGRVQINLQDKDDYEYGETGLIWRKSDTIQFRYNN